MGTRAHDLVAYRSCPSTAGATAGRGAISARSSTSRSIGRSRSDLCTLTWLARSSNQASSWSWYTSIRYYGLFGND